MANRLFSHLLRGVWLLWLWQAVSVVEAGSKLWEVPTGPFTFSSSSNLSEGLHWEPHCLHHHLQDRVRITALVPPKLDGTWVSTRCEVRPGPEFLTRSYTFHQNRHFQALQHYYSDSSCEEPSYSLMIQGKIRLRKASWFTRGGTEAEHHLNKVGIVLHSLAAKQRLTSRLPRSCASLSLGQAVPGKLYELYNTRAGRGCLMALGFSMLELDLVRVETQHHSHGGKVQELFLGDIHTDWTQRTQYRPTGYQQPLQNAVHHVHPCPACALVFRSSEHRPAVLPHSPAASLSLAGRWVSQRCETRPTVLFVTRDFTFDPNQHIWEGVYRHYTDPSCSQPTFTLRASGHYAQGNPSVKLSGAFEFVFKVTQVRITAMDEPTAKLLNGTRPGKCGQAGGWEVGAEQDLTPTDGCTVLGIKLPHKEYELFKIAFDHRKHPLLFTGERPTDGSSPDRPIRRPTSFQAPMVLCSGGDIHPANTGFNSRQVQPAASGTRALVWLRHLVFMSVLYSSLYVY